MKLRTRRPGPRLTTEMRTTDVSFQSLGWGSDEVGGQGERVFFSPLASLVAPVGWFQCPVVTWLF